MTPKDFPITFLWPDFLWLLVCVPLLVLGYWLLLRRKKKVAVRHDRRHSAWRHAYAQQDCKVVKVRKHVDGRLIVKKIRRCV